MTSYQYALADVPVWVKHLQSNALLESQARFFESCDESYTHYRSGASNYNDLSGYAAAGAPVCVIASKLSARATSRLIEHLDDGGLAMVDSGQFGDFCAKIQRITDYPRVMKRYRHIALGCKRPDKLTIVAPDLIGDAEGSLNLLLDWQSELRELIALGVRVIVPVQNGRGGVDVFVDKAFEKLGSQVVLGIPCKESPLSEADILDVMRLCRPKNVHFLGLPQKRRQILYKSAHLLDAGAVLTSDSTRLRAHLGEGRVLTEIHRHLTSEELERGLYGGGDFAHLDWTEAVGYLCEVTEQYLTNAELNRLIKELTGSSSPDLRAAVRDAAAVGSECFWELLDDLAHGYAFELAQRWHETEARREVSPKMRSVSIHLAYSEGAA